LGLAKRLVWETAGHWKTDLPETAAGSTASPDSPAKGASTAELLAELERLHGLLDQLRLSRWRKLGHWLGLARRFPWESGGSRNPLLIKPFPSEEVALSRAAEVEAALSRAVEVKAGASRSSYAGFIEYANERFLEECRGFAIDVIFDIGANIGQFAQG